MQKMDGKSNPQQLISSMQALMKESSVFIFTEEDLTPLVKSVGTGGAGVSNESSAEI
jgi:hypothetical protein